MTQDFKNLNIWQRAHELTVDIYRLTKSFPADELYGLTQQLRRAIVSVELNIAEGTAGSGKQLLRYLHLALGSCKETECCIILAKDLGYIDVEHHDELVNRARKLQGMIVNFTKTIAVSLKSERTPPSNRPTV